MRRVTTAVVGVGPFGSMLLREQLLTGPGSPHLCVTSVCDVDVQRARELASTHGMRCAADLDAVLRDPAVEAVALFTGPDGRADLIRRAIRAGKHVITTKPFELDPVAAESVLLEARQRGLIVHLNSPGPLPTPDLRQILDWAQEFDLGRPVGARGEAWAHYRESADGKWYDDPDRCPLAPVFRIGIYLINDLVRLFGEPEAVQAFGSRLFTGRPTPDNGQVGLRFANGALANVFASFCVNDGHFWRNSLTLNYAGGTVYRNVGPSRGGDSRRQPELKLMVRRGDEIVVREATVQGSSEDYQWDAFHRAVRLGRPADEIEPGQVAAAIRVVAALRQAELTGKTVPVARPKAPEAKALSLAS